MKILVTGAAGHLGRHVAAALAAEQQVVALDVLPPPEVPGILNLQADLADRTALDDALATAGQLGPIEMVVHCASIHPWKSYTDAQYLDVNVKGTWQLYSAAQNAGVRRIVLTSSIAAIGYHVPAAAWPVSEDSMFGPTDLYSLSKQMQEDIARHFAHNFGVTTFALRPPAFMPLPARETGLGLLGSFSVVRDIAAAHVAAVAALAGVELRDSGQFEAFFVTNSVPYDAKDIATIARDGHVEAAIGRHFPEALAWYRGQNSPVKPVAVYNLEKARRILGWEPQYNFAQWWQQRELAKAKSTL